MLNILINRINLLSFFIYYESFFIIIIFIGLYLSFNSLILLLILSFLTSFELIICLSILLV
jgi:hypothetical protein